MANFLWIFSAISAVIVGKFIYGWYAEIAKRNRNSEINNRLLTLIAKKLNATDQEVNEALNV